VTAIGRSLVDAAAACSTTPASALGLTGFGAITDGAAADLVVLDRGLAVIRTFIRGHQVYRRRAR
jgi:N-acetylglucosamine-6-phosphate deacetylase